MRSESCLAQDDLAGVRELYTKALDSLRDFFSMILKSQIADELALDGPVADVAEVVVSRRGQTSAKTGLIFETVCSSSQFAKNRQCSFFRSKLKESFSQLSHAAVYRILQNSSKHRR
jgi:hypothetical protein